MNTIINKIRNFGLASLALLTLGSCSDILDEQPRTDFDPNFFTQQGGVEGGLTALYAHLRDTYGQGYYYNNCETGTDEYTYGQGADANFKDADLSGAGSLTPESSRSDVLWNSSFTYINTASGVIENGTAAGMAESLLSEARFFRAFDYFRLVQMFGGVPLDLGSGELKFNITPARVSKRNTVPEVYTKAIFPDLLIAIENLPESGRVTGGVTKTAARLVLAQAYLTYGWWLENPNDIPTYPECDRVDPDGHDAQWYFQAAYDTALEGIQNPGPFALQPTFYDVHLGSNDRNNEILLYADHTENSEEYNGGSLSYGSGGAPDNFASWMVAWSYDTMTALRGNDASASFTPVLRAATQDLGRPWVRMAPPQEVFKNTFADKTYDSRYDGTFTTVFRSNWNLSADYADLQTAINPYNKLEIRLGEPVMTFLDEDIPGIKYLTAEELATDKDKGHFGNSVGGGWLPDRPDYVVGPSAISRRKFPILWKLGPYRTDNNGTIGQPNAGSTRPFNILKFSELYFAAAEAAVKGAQTQPNYSARELINKIRGRAGVWRFSNAKNEVYEEDFSQEMKDATPQTITIDYILDELSREYFGEGHRWFDLVRTQTWAERAATYTIADINWDSHEPQTFTRDIPKEYYLRPIPQSQLDAMEMTAEERDAFQNPGYRY
ncbi:MAG TPA: RagB/SusD family nutrient uptake outer membrane protein [Candidatus Prevotella stercoripullorum]|nr:RagB/SusD family nutrient uptake outer membrane protein [Candidatus Prevotella stercoripullorum]